MQKGAQMRARTIAGMILALVLAGCLTGEEGRTAASQGAGGGPDANVERAAIPDEYKWDLTPLCRDEAAFEEQLAAVDAGLGMLEAFEGSLSDPARLLRCLELYFESRLAANELTLYASLRHDTELASGEIQSMHDRALAAMRRLMAAGAFIRQEVLALDDAAVESAYRGAPALEDYRAYLDELRRRRSRVLGQEAEGVLTLAGDNLWAEIDLNEIPSHHEKAFGALIAELSLPSIEDEEGRTVQLALSNYGKYRGSSSRRVRRDAVAGLFGTLAANQNAIAACFAGQIDYTVFLARARGYDTAVGAYLDKDDLDPAVLRNLIGAIHANLEPLHEYVELRKQVMGLEDLHIYDLYAPMVSGVEMEVPFEEAARILPLALAPLGPQVQEILRAGLDTRNGWIDLYPHRGKESGAYSASVYGRHPYIKMNYMDDFDGLMTLAHEFGHAAHTSLSSFAQPYITAGYVPFIAEVASTCNEKLLFDHLLAEAENEDERLAILNQIVETIRTTIYRQTLFAEFELRTHSAAEQGTPLTAEFLRATYRDLVQTYYGPGFTVDEHDDIEWAYIPHLYYKYYVFTYATGLASGIALAERIQSGGVEAREAYLGMLRGGSSQPPLELLRGAGVDLTTPQPIEAAARLMSGTIAQMREILDSRGR